MIDDLFSLDGQVVFVTGGAGGLGQVMARATAGAGAHVVINDVDEAALEAELAAMAAAGLKASGMGFDVADEKARAAAVPSIVADHGRLDVLINKRGHRQERARPRALAGKLAATYRHRPYRVLPPRPRGDQAHARARQRPDHQYLIDHGHPGRRLQCRLHGSQGRPRRADEGAGGGIRPARHHVQR